LRRLGIKAPLGDAGAVFLAQAPLVNLSGLDVSGCDIGPDGLRLLANSPHLRQLVSLVAFRNCFGCDGIAALAASPLAEQLHVLEAQNTGIGDRGIAALADSPLLDRLLGPGLNLSMNPIGNAGVQALAARPDLAPFTELILRECRVSDAGASALASSPNVANLVYLDLWQNRVGDVGARALAASPHLGNMNALSLRDNIMSAAGEDVLRKRFGDRVKL
jgi:Ran GTPase-activating protein (RanGAP) involved in mRNA processing and transport